MLVSIFSLQKITWRELFQRYLTLYATPRHAPKTISAHMNSAKAMMPYLGDLPIDKIKQGIVDSYIAVRKSQGVSARTVNLDLALLSKTMHVALEWELIKVLPWRKIKLLDEGDYRVRYLTPDEKERLFSILHSPLREIVQLALATGMRKGELRRLVWSQVDFAHRQVTLEKTKTGKKRVVPLNITALEALHRMPRRIGTEFVFWNEETGKPLVSIAHMFRKACRRAGIENFHFHDLRHTYASWLVQSGVSIQAVQEFLGHRSLAMTLRYAHLSQGAKQQWANRIDDVFSLSRQKSFEKVLD